MAEQGSTTHYIRDINSRIRAIVEKETLGKPFWIGGLVRRLHLSDLGHLYFDLYDEDYSIECIVREPIRLKLGFTIEKGMELEVFGSIRLYDKRASVQLEVEEARLIARQSGAIYVEATEYLKKKGLYPKNKKTLPAQSNTIALITSRRSEAQHDFEKNYRDAGGKAGIKLKEVRVQGQQAPQEIADTIALLNREANADVIVLTRGGGRQADMGVFDDVIIAEAICRSEIPVVTAIGHEQDTFFADEVADKSCSTPTAAAFFLASYVLQQAGDRSKENKDNRDQNMILLGIGVLIVASVLILILLR